jgi:plasmid stabilization system protein ParE
MARKLEYSRAARRDLEQMRAWLSQPGAGQRAKDRARDIARAVKNLRDTPVGWPRGDMPGTRQCVVKGYTIVYSVHPDTSETRSAGDIYVVRVFGPGQDTIIKPNVARGRRR